ncbi:MAG: O-antigen ligase family protein [Chitinophagales bacterium]
MIAVPFCVLFFWAGWQKISSILFLLLFTLPFSTEWQITSELGTDLPDELLMLLAAGLVVCYWFYSPQLLPAKIIRHPLIVLLSLTVAWTIVTILSSAYPLISVKFLLAKCWYIGAFVLAPLIVFRNKNSIKTAMLILAITMLLVVLIVLLRHSQYSFSFAEINDVLKPFFRNHVNYSAMLVCIIPVFFAFYRLTASKATRVSIIMAIIVLIVALFMSYARGAWLALIIGLAVYWLISRRLLLIVYILAVVMATIAVFWLKSGDRYMQYAHNYRTTIFHPDFREHLQATYELKDLSTAERFYRWIAAVRMIGENPITGYGPNTFYNNYKPYAIPAFKTWVSNNKEHSTVHNYFLLIAVEQGIPGLLFFLLFVGGMICYAQVLYHRVKDPFYKTVALTIAVVLIMILTVNSLSDLIETDKIGSLFFLCLSLLIITDVNNKRSSSDSSPDIQSIS